MGRKQKDKGMPARFVRTVAILGIIFLGYQGLKVAKVSLSLDDQIKEVQKEVAVQDKKLEALKLEYENIESLNTVEGIAREKLGLVKPDEIVFREKY